MPTLNHAHKFKRFKYANGTKIFHCILPDCNYKTEVQFSLGKRSTCNRCGDEFIMNEKSLRLKLPHCEECTLRKTIVDGEVKYLAPKRLKSDALSNVADNMISDLKQKITSVVHEIPDE